MGSEGLLGVSRSTIANLLFKGGPNKEQPYKLSFYLYSQKSHLVVILKDFIVIDQEEDV